MPDPTPGDAELQRSRDLIAKAWADPELRPGLRKHVKELFPDRRLPDDDFDAISAPLRQQNEALSKQIEEMRASLKKRDEDAEKREQERRDADYGRSLDVAARRFALTDEGREKMFAHMRASGNYTDPMGAAALVASETPPALPSGPLYGPNSIHFAGTGETDQEKYKVLLSGLRGPEEYLEREIREAFGPGAKDYVAREMGKTYAELAFAS